MADIFVKTEELFKLNAQDNQEELDTKFEDFDDELADGNRLIFTEKDENGRDKWVRVITNRDKLAEYRYDFKR